MTRVELFRLGYLVEANDKKYGPRKQPSPPSFQRDSSQPVEMDWPSHELRILVLGSQGCGKTTLLHSLQQGSLPVDSMMPSTSHPETCGTHLRLRRKRVKATKKMDDKVDEMEDFVIHYIFTEVPEDTPRDVLMEILGSTTLMSHGNTSGGSNNMSNPNLTTTRNRVYDMVLLVFDSTSMSSFEYVRELESSLLTDEIPRVFCGTKRDSLSRNPEEPSEADNAVQEATEVAKAASDHCSDLDLEPPLVVWDEGTGNEKLLIERERALEHIAHCALEDIDDKKLRSKPHEEQKRKEAVRRRKMFWFGGLVTVGVAVLVGVGIWWSGRSKPQQRQQRM
jgi:GTPase SAR1 family protein